MNTNRKDFVYSFDERDGVVDYIKGLMAEYAVFAFIGPLGAGKTTLIKSLLRECGVRGNVTSPTFTYMNEYVNEMGQKFYHFDLYRITNVQEFQAQGFDEYLFQHNSWAFVEWPEIINPLLTKNVCFIACDYTHDADKRTVTIQCV